jgi:hypothetical protein
MKANKKVVNATPFEYNGIKFKSRLEVYVYRRLLEEGFNFGYEQKQWEIIEKFEYMGEKVRAIKIKPDFVDFKSKVIIEAKGWATDIYKLRLKLFKRHLVINNTLYDIYHVKNQKEVESLIKDLKSNVQSSRMVVEEL